MSVASEISRIKSNIADAYDEAEAKGATMPATENSANLADTVASIPTGSTPTLITKRITENGTYAAEDDNADGYSEVAVDVPDESKAVLNSLIDRSITTITSDVTSIGSYAFINCQALTEVSFPEATSIESSAFNNCQALTEVSFPCIKSIGSYAFDGCTGLQYFDVSKVAKVPTISSNTFNRTTCIFLFRSKKQLNQYASATNWSALADRFQIKEVTP